MLVLFRFILHSSSRYHTRLVRIIHFDCQTPTHCRRTTTIFFIVPFTTRICPLFCIYYLIHIGVHFQSLICTSAHPNSVSDSHSDPSSSSSSSLRLTVNIVGMLRRSTTSHHWHRRQTIDCRHDTWESQENKILFSQHGERHTPFALVFVDGFHDDSTSDTQTNRTSRRSSSSVAWSSLQCRTMVISCTGILVLFFVRTAHSEWHKNHETIAILRNEVEMLRAHSFLFSISLRSFSHSSSACVRIYLLDSPTCAVHCTLCTHSVRSLYLECE